MKKLPWLALLAVLASSQAHAYFSNWSCMPVGQVSHFQKGLNLLVERELLNEGAIFRVSDKRHGGSASVSPTGIRRIDAKTLSFNTGDGFLVPITVWTVSSTVIDDNGNEAELTSDDDKFHCTLL